LFLITGSPLRKGFQDLWAPLNICDHVSFSSYWAFVRTFGYMQENEWGAWEILGLKEKDALARRIAPRYIRREKDVLPDLPPSRRSLDRVVDMTPGQAKMYSQLEKEMFLELTDGSLLLTGSHLAKITRLRQILCSPKILDPHHTEFGGLLEELGMMLEETDDYHFVVFTPFTKAIPVIDHYLQNRPQTKKHTIIRLQGGLKAQQVTDRLIEFRNEKGIAIVSIQYAESFDLVPAKWSFFCGFSWDVFNDNLQAEARLHRFTTKSAVTHYYPLYRHGLDRELMIPILDQKSSEGFKVFDSTRRLRQAILDSQQRN
jgi:SNF2 family DNA or RNA helicase